MRFGIGKKVGPFRAGISMGRGGLGWGAGVGPVHFTDGTRGRQRSINDLSSDDKIVITDEELWMARTDQARRLEKEKDVFGGLKRDRYKSSGFCPHCAELVAMGSLICFSCEGTVADQIQLNRVNPPSGERTFFEIARFNSEVEKLQKELQHIGNIQDHLALRAREERLHSVKQKMESEKREKKKSGSVAKVFTFTIKWLSILSLLAGAFWVTTNFHPIMAIAAGGLTLLVAGGNNPEGPRGWVAWCLGAVLNGLWFVFTLVYQPSNSFFEDSPPWTRFLNFPSLVVVESIILIVVFAVLPNDPTAYKVERTRNKNSVS